MKLGFHVSCAGRIFLAVQRALERECEVFQLFYSSPASWRQKKFQENELEMLFELACKQNALPFYFHAPYLINLCSPSLEIRKKSIALLRFGFECSLRAGNPPIVLHMGSAGNMDKNRAIATFANSIAEALEGYERMKVLLENSAGQGSFIGSSLVEIAEIIERCGDKSCQLGLCFDTCHGFAAGYDITTPEGVKSLKTEISKTVGLDRLELFHLNDSKWPLGSKRDRHEEIGKGLLGLEAFRNLLSDCDFKRVPGIMETPGKSVEADLRNLTILRTLRDSTRKQDRQRHEGNSFLSGKRSRKP